jgi:hypothetical protein
MADSIIIAIHQLNTGNDDTEHDQYKLHKAKHNTIGGLRSTPLCSA